MAKIAFLQHIWYETIGPMYLSACVKARGHACDVFIGRDSQIIKGVVGYMPDIICFSVMTAQFPWALNMARTVKKRLPNVIVAFGGAHATFFPEIIEEDGIDVICIGEGEGALADLADNIALGKNITGIKNLHVKKDGKIFKNEIRDFVRDLDTLPLPDRSLYYKYKFLASSPEKSFMSGRGCPYDCTFCFNHIYMQLYKGKGPFIRQRRVEHVVREIKDVQSRYGLKLVFFQDDTWVLNKGWLYEFLPRYKKEIGLPFIAYVRADIVDEELVRKLKDANCQVVDMGMETGDETRRNELLKKKISDDELRNAAGLMRKHKLNFRVTNMVGLPGETLEDALTTLSMNIELKPTFSWCAIFQPFPKLELTNKALEKGFIKTDTISGIKGSYNKSLLRMDGIDQIINLQKLFILTVRFPFLLPVVKRLIKCPNNPIFNMIGFLSYAFMYYRYTRTSIIRLSQEAMKMFLEGSYEHVS